MGLIHPTVSPVIKDSANHPYSNRTCANHPYYSSKNHFFMKPERKRRSLWKPLDYLNKGILQHFTTALLPPSRNIGPSRSFTTNRPIHNLTYTYSLALPKRHYWTSLQSSKGRFWWNLRDSIELWRKKKQASHTCQLYAPSNKTKARKQTGQAIISWFGAP